MIILPDNDEPGRRHADDVSRSCRKAGIPDVRIVTLPGVPEKGDVSDWIGAGHTVDEIVALAEAAGKETASDARDSTPGAGRRLKLTAASNILVRPVRWLWRERLPLGVLALLAGRERIGKSILAYTIAATITRGELEGAFTGAARSVIVVATEDSWEHTIVPRLMAAGADLTKVYRVDVTTADLGQAELSVPRDLPGLEASVKEVQAAAIILDPLMSRLDVQLDTHRTARLAGRSSRSWHWRTGRASPCWGSYT